MKEENRQMLIEALMYITRVNRVLKERNVPVIFKMNFLPGGDITTFVKLI